MQLSLKETADHMENAVMSQTITIAMYSRNASQLIKNAAMNVNTTFSWTLIP